MKLTHIVTLAAVLSLTTASVAGAQGFAHAFSRELGQLESQVRYETTVFGQQSVKDQDTDLGFTRYDLDIVLPLFQNESYETALTAGIGATDLATRAAMLDAQTRLPDHLWDIALGGKFRKRLDNEWIAGMSLSVGSPSDRPFDSLGETTLNATATLQIPAGNGNQHLLSLNYATNRDVLQYVPLPGYAYHWNQGRRAHVLLGLPFSWAQWRPTEALTLQAAYVIPRTVHAKASYEIIKGLELYSGFDWQSRQWFRAGRSDDDDRLFYYEKKATLGLQIELAQGLTIDLTGGYGFDRFFFEGEDYDDRGDSRISFGDGLFAAAEIALLF